MLGYILIALILFSAAIYFPLSCEGGDTTSGDIEDIDAFPYDVEP